MRLLFFFFLILILFQQVLGFSNVLITESIGGIVANERVLADRRRIDDELAKQLESPIVASSSDNALCNLTFTCFQDNLTFDQNSRTLHSFVCNLTGKIDKPIVVSFDTDIHDLASLQPPFWIYYSPGLIDRKINITTSRLRMGSVYLNIWVREAKPNGPNNLLHSFDRSNETSIESYTRWLLNGSAEFEQGPGFAAMGCHLKILRARGILEVIFRIVVAVMVCFLTLIMGCELDAKLIWGFVKKPIAPLVGFICQFGLMPLLAFGVAMLMPIKSEFGFGLLTAACSPGGGGSNIWTLLLRGDLNLSMTMTFISSVAALGMTPLMLLIYGRYFLDPKLIKIPYLQIAGQVCYIVVPVLIGMLIKWRFPDFAKRVVKLLLRPLAFTFLAVVVFFGFYVNLQIYELILVYPLLFPAAALLPWCGFLFSAVLAAILRRSKAEVVTISIETGIQNIGIAILVLLYSMPQPEGDIGAVMPLIVSALTPLPLLLAYAVITIREGRCSRCCRKKTKEVDQVDAEEKQQLRRPKEVIS